MTFAGSGDGPSGSARAHFVLVPMMAQGHTIPMTDMARLLAEHGAQRSSAYPGCENLDMIQSKNLFLNFMETCAALQEPLMAYLREQQRLPPSCIISDLVHWWTGDIARELDIPRLTFNGFCGFSSLIRYITYHNNVFQNVKDENELITITGFPTPLELTKAKCPGNFCIPGMKQIRKKFLEEELKSDGEVINSFQELETLYIESFEQTTKKKPGSVVFVSFGSLACTTPQQLVELGLGLETSRKPFIWVIKAGAKLPEVEEWLADEFEERVKNRGMVIRGWAPQLMILQYQAVGGFVTHCGWNSTVEGICAGVPMITWPHFGEQFLNEKLLVDVLKIGMEVGVKGVTQWGSENQEVMVTRDEVQKAVNTLMDEGAAAEEMRVRAKDCAIKARRAFNEGGSSYDNIRLLIQEMEIKTNACGSVVDTDGNKLSFLV
ncbi:hypothetical protein CFC21_040367 [Triticum aestivum]|uniref:Glycosyltransferase n=2 Tax=Triticum aestivum TaxID=4565 RepID=A0A3B6FHW3_WHEAT|nr:hypothetical protein CFC21_040367 [Triticum aestivum]